MPPWLGKGPFLGHRLIASSHGERDKEALWGSSLGFF